MKQTVRFRYAREKEYHDATQHFVSASWHFSHQTQYIVYALKINLFPLDKSYYMGLYFLYFHSHNIRKFVNILPAIFGR